MKTKQLFLNPVSLTRTTYDNLREGFFIAETGSVTSFNKEDQQFLCLKDGRYFTDTINLLDGEAWFDHGPLGRIWYFKQLDGLWQIMERE